MISHQRIRARQAFTLFELLLVMVIIVMVAAIAVPTLQNSFKTQRLKKAADLVRSEWTRARINAMRQGEEFAFFYQPETGQYWIAPFASVYASTPPDLEQESTTDNFEYGNGMLPRSILFHQGDSVDDTRSLNLALEGAGSPNMILFYPDGTTQDAELVLKNEREHYIRLTLRSLTGMPKVSDVLNADEVTSE